MKISLICPVNYQGGTATGGIYYPMGILAVGTRLRQAFPDVEVAVVDSEIDPRPLEEVIRGSNLVGFSANTNNYQHVKDGARIAKQQGMPVVVGGPHASAVMRYQGKSYPMAANILRNDQNIDAVIVHDGEGACVSYLRERQKQKPDFAGIKNLFWRAPDGEIRGNEVVVPTRPPLQAELDFSLMDFSHYWSEHEKEYPAMPGRFIEGFTHVGCNWRDKSGGCTFCDIPYPKNRYVPPKVFWNDLQAMQERWGIRSFKDYGDCLTGNAEAVRDLLAARPAGLESIAFSCYGRSSEITDDMADMLLALNVKYTYIGLDSGSTRMLKSMNEGYAPRHSLDAIGRLWKRKINVSGSLILGAVGESEETIKETGRFAAAVLEYPNVTQLHCSVLLPFPGAPLASEFIAAAPEFLHQDVWDMDQAQLVWQRRYCKAPSQEIEGWARTINSLNPSARKRYFGLHRQGLLRN